MRLVVDYCIEFGVPENRDAVATFVVFVGFEVDFVEISGVVY